MRLYLVCFCGSTNTDGSASAVSSEEKDMSAVERDMKQLAFALLAHLVIHHPFLRMKVAVFARQQMSSSTAVLRFAGSDGAGGGQQVAQDAV